MSLLLHQQSEMVKEFLLTAIFALVRIALVKCTPGCGILPEGSELVQCSVVYRHGDRNPVSEYLHSEFKDLSNWPEGWGQLTVTGTRQHLRFGRWLMETYGPKGHGLLPPSFNVNDYRVVSTDVDRTIMSGLSNTAGMYRPTKGKEIEEGIEWQPIPIRAIPADENDEIFAQYCPVVQETVNKLREARFEELRKEKPDLFEYAEDHSGYGIATSPLRMFWLYDTLVVENATYGKIPEWAKSIFPHPLQSYEMEFFQQFGFTEKLRRLTGGPVLKNIIGTMVSKTLGNETTKFFSYSSHDTTVFNVLNALGIPPHAPPGYTAAVIFELYKSPGGIYNLRALYRQGPDMEPLPLIIPGCGGTQICRLESFLEATAHILPGDLKEECRVTTIEYTELVKDRNNFIATQIDPFLR